MAVRLLLDENISPFLIRPLGALDVYAEAVAAMGLAGKPDISILQYARDQGMTLVTANAQDFAKPPEMESCPGVILLRESGLDREGQWARLKPAVLFVKQEGGSKILINKLVDITALDWFYVMPMPETQPR